MESSNGSLSRTAPPKVRFICISGYHETGKSTVARDIIDFLQAQGLEATRMSVASDHVRQMTKQAFGNISDAQYEMWKPVLRPWLEMYGELERKLLGDYNRVNELFILVEILYGGNNPDPTIVVVDDARYLNQVMSISSQLDALSIQLIPQVALSEMHLLPTEVDLPLIKDHIPSLRQVTAKLPTTTPTCLAIVRKWLEKESMRKWLNE